MSFKIIIKTGCLLAIHTLLSGFVLFSGPEESKLPATPEQPTITFIWDGKYPTFKNKEKFESGQYAGLSDDQLMMTLIQFSMNKWNEVNGSFLKLELNTTASSSAQMDVNDKVNSIVTKTNSNLSTAAFAIPYDQASDSKGVISDCDIQISDKETSVTSLAYTLIHELGHCIGLGHNHSDYNAIMGYSRSDRSLTLGMDDMAGLIYLYSDPTVFTDKPKELLACGTIKNPSKPNHHPISNNILLSLPIVLAFLAGITSRTSRTKQPSRVSRFFKSLGQDFF